MVRLGPYKQVFEAHRTSFIKSGYPAIEASALAQAIVAMPLPETALGRPSAYFEASVPSARLMLEFTKFEGISLKVNDAVQANQSMFSDRDDPSYLELIVSGVYPGTPGLVVVKAENTDCWYAADWELSEGGDVKLSNVRDIGTYYETLTIGVIEGLQPAFDLVLEDMAGPLEIEKEYLAAKVVGAQYYIPRVVLDGVRPVEEMEYVKFLRNSKVLTESFSTPFELPETIIESSIPDAVGRLAIVTRRLGIIECDYADAMKSMKLKKSKKEQTEQRRITEAGDFRTIGGHTVNVDDEKAGKGDLEHVKDQIVSHNKLRSKLKDMDFTKNGNSGYGDGETHTKDAGNGYHVRVSLAGGKASTTLHRNGGPMVKAVGTTKSADTMSDHIGMAMVGAASQPEVTGYGV